MPGALSPRQHLALRLLATGESACAAAEGAGVTPQTISEWRKQPLFRAALAAMLYEADREALDALYILRSKAIERLAGVLDVPEPGAVMKAIQLVLEKTERPYLAAVAARGASADPSSENPGPP